jgi:hypothetical protein
MVDKATYESWEAQVVNAFYTPERRPTQLIPVDGKPAVLSKEKYILVVDAVIGEDATSTKVAANDTQKLAPHQHVMLWHIGKQKDDKVKFGFSEEEGIFKHPACDVGGLTNLKQTIGKPVSFVGTPIPWNTAAGAPSTVAEAIASQWRQLSGKDLDSTLESNIARFLSTVEPGERATMCVEG